LWQAELYATDMARSNPQNRSTAAKTLAAIHHLHVWTPRYVENSTKPEAFPQLLSSLEEGIMKYNFSNWAWQLKAIMEHDISKPFGKSMEQAAKAVRAKTLIIWAQQDLAVNSDPAQSFAKLLQSETFILGGNCGHLAFLCEGEALRDTVKRFLGE
jgi:homoserine O-acetyltransferase/O-succinyltransferase